MAVTGRDGDDPRERDADLPHDAADARIAALYRQASGEEPPARLDRAIQTASRPMRTQSERPAPWWLPWRAPFAVAALAVVSVSLVTLMMEQEPERTATLQDALPTPPPRTDAAAPAEARDAVRESPAAAAAQSAAGQEPQRVQERSRAE